MVIAALLAYSARVSILVEIAEKADVSVEGVVRVLTREPVSDAIKERVLTVLDDLTPEQTRAVQRFALAALHDVLEPQANTPEWPEPTAVPDESQLVLPVAGPVETPANVPAGVSSGGWVVSRRFVPSGYNPKQLSVEKYLPFALAEAKKLVPDAVLFRIDADGVYPDGHADITLASNGSLDFRFISPKHAKPDPKLPLGAKQEYKCMFRIMLDGEGV